MDLDLADDYLILDGLEPVTVRTFSARSLNDAGTISATSTDVAVASALRRQMDLREIDQSGGKLRLGDIVWEVPVTLHPNQINEGDLVIAGTETWAVMRVDLATLRTRWRLVARLEG